MSGAWVRTRPRPRRLALLSVVVALLVGGCLPAAATAEGRQIGGLYDVFVVIAAGVFLLVYALATFADHPVPRAATAGPRRTPAGRGQRPDGDLGGGPVADHRQLYVGTLAVLSRTEARAATPAASPPCAGSAGAGSSTTRPRASLSAGSDPQRSSCRPDSRFQGFMISSDDVIHSFYVPGPLQARRHPRRENVFDVTVEEAGTYHGQCQEFCGVGHSAMPFHCAPSRRRTTRRGWRRSARAALVGPRPLPRGDVPPQAGRDDRWITVRPVPPAGSALVWLTTTDHKQIE